MAILLADEDQGIIDYLGLLPSVKKRKPLIFSPTDLALLPAGQWVRRTNLPSAADFQFTDLHRFLLIFLVVSRKKHIFATISVS